MPKSPIREFAVGVLSAEEYYTNARATHYEFRCGSGARMVVFPHELPELRRLVEMIEADRSRPRLVLSERGSA